jgi:hypothetical protein
MPDDDNIVDFFAKQQAHLAKLEEQARLAARTAKEAADEEREARRAEESYTEADIIGFSWPWDERPWELPLLPHELRVAMRLAKLNTRLAARILRVSLERLEIALERTEWKGLIRKRRPHPEQESPVSAVRRGRQLVIKVKKPAKAGQLQIGFDEAGDLIIVVENALSETTLSLVKKAEEIAGKQQS